MSVTPRLTLYGMNAYTDGDIFADMVLPEGLSASEFIDRLIMTRGELSVLWPDPLFMKMMVTAWSKNWLPSFTRIYQSLTAEYNPLHNYDRHEEYTDTEGESRTGSSTASGSLSSDVESKVSAYNERTYQPDSMTTTGTETESSDNSQERRDRSLEHEAHLYGNIGVTKSQEMLTDEIEVRSRYRIYDIMGDVFAQELLILVY